MGDLSQNSDSDGAVRHLQGFMPQGLNAPDLIEPLLGFRAWVLGPHGSLEAVTAQTSWDRGENVASCPVGDHEGVPGEDCVCGLYALHDVADPRLNPAMFVIGSIAAWGDIEIYGTGFRAERAMILGLSYHPRMSRGSGRRLKMASEFYDVRVVQHARLADYSLRFARPLDRTHLPNGRGRTLGGPTPKGAALGAPGGPAASAPASIRAPYKGPGRWVNARKAAPQGIWVPHHVWSRPIGNGERARIGITPAFAAMFADRRGTRLTLASVGSEVERGDIVGVFHTPDGPLAIRSPHSGWISAHNPDLPSLRSVAGSPGGSGWIMAVRPVEGEDSPALAAGPHGEASYEAYLRRMGGDAPLRASLHPDAPWPPRGIPRDPARESPLADLDALEEILLPVLEKGLDPVLCRSLAAFAERVVFEVRDPGAGLTIRSMGGVEGIGAIAEISEQAGPATGTDEEIRMRLTGVQLHKLFSGELDLPRALSGEEIELVSGTREKAVLAISVLRRLFPAYRERADARFERLRRGLTSLERERARRARARRGRMRSA